MTALTKTKTSYGFGYSLNGRPVGYVRHGRTTRTDVVPAQVGLSTGRLLAILYTPAQAAKLAAAGVDVIADGADSPAPVMIAAPGVAERIIADAVNARI